MNASTAAILSLRLSRFRRRCIIPVAAAVGIPAPVAEAIPAIAIIPVPMAPSAAVIVEAEDIRGGGEISLC